VPEKAAAMNLAPDVRFSLVVGGPFRALLGSLGLLDRDELPALRAAVLAALLAWLPPALLALLQAIVSADYSGRDYFTDHFAYARYLVAIFVMVITERAAHVRLDPIVRQFTDARLVQEDCVERFARALTLADRRTASSLAEVAVALLALGFAVTSFTHNVALTHARWDGATLDGAHGLSWAGWWACFISTPLFQFLMLRWFWRFGVWAWLLWTVSRLRLRLVAFHPDRAAGLGFLSVYPTVFTGLIFATSCVVASQLVSQATLGGANLGQLRFFVIAWLALNLVVFIGPLLVFYRPLNELRVRSIYALGKRASEHQSEFQRKWIDGDANGKEMLGSTDVSSAADLNSIAASPYALRMIPVGRAEIVQLLLATGIPMLAVVATQMPLTEFAKRVAAAVL
jgi:hypothetical protein